MNLCPERNRNYIARACRVYREKQVDDKMDAEWSAWIGMILAYESWRTTRQMTSAAGTGNLLRRDGWRLDGEKDNWRKIMAGKNTAIGGGGFHHVSIKVKDIEVSEKFYTEVLGMTKTISWGEGEKRAMMLDAGDGACIELFAGGSTDPLPAGAIWHFALRSDDPDKAIERARAAGAAITVEPKDVLIPSTPPTPVRIAFCKGPDGESIEFFKNK